MEQAVVTITEKAAEQIAALVSKRGKGVGVRLSLKAYGCSGFGFALTFVDAPEQDDLPSRQGLQEGFRIDNPNATSACGCGKSFAL